MLDIVLRLDATAARSATKGRPWIAEANLDGTTLDARSHNGASYALARKLVAEGVPDQPVRVRQEGLDGRMMFASLYRMAERTIGESATKPIRSTPYREHPGSNLDDAVSPPDA